MNRGDIIDLFKYHRPTPEKAAQHEAVNEKTAEMALWLFDNLPPCAETTLAVRAVHDARFHANTAIAVRS